MAKKAAKEEEKSGQEPILFHPLTDKGDYPALVIYGYASDVKIGIEKLTEKGTNFSHGGYYGHGFDSMIKAVDRTLWSYKISNTQRKKMKIDEFLEMCREHVEMMNNFMNGEVEKCRTKL
jgi:hypothetical protein